MEISCVIPSFENLELLADCLASVMAQRDADLEIVVTDDSRDSLVRDHVAGLIQAFPAVRYLQGPRGGNPVDNWNHGLSQARGALRLLVHHDEVLLDRRYLRRAIDAMADPGVAAVVGGVAVEGASRFVLAAGAARMLGSPRWVLPAINWIGPTAAFVFRQDHRFDPALVQLADVEFYRRILATGRMKRLAGVCVGSLGRHAAQITARIDPRALALAELRDLAGRARPSITPIEHAVLAAWWRLRSW